MHTFISFILALMLAVVWGIAVNNMLLSMGLTVLTTVPLIYLGVLLDE